MTSEHGAGTFQVAFTKSYHREDGRTIDVDGYAVVDAESAEAAEEWAAKNIRSTLDSRITWEEGEDPVMLGERGYTYTDWSFGVVRRADGHPQTQQGDDPTGGA